MNTLFSDNKPEDIWYILGKGAIACLWASYLRALNKNVIVIERNHVSKKAHKQTLVPQNIVYQDCTNIQTHQSKAKITNNVLLTNTELLPIKNKKIARLIIATKSQDVITAITPLLPALAFESNILLLCNGYGIHETVNTLLNQQNKNIFFFAGVSSDGALLEKAFFINHTGKGLTTIGQYPSTTLVASNPITQLKISSNEILKISSSHYIQKNILEKFFINCAINPLTTLLKCRNGGLLSEPAAKKQFELLCEELQEIYNKHCSNDSKKQASFNVYENASAVALQTSNNISSMLKDRQAGRPLEIQFLTEKVIQLANEHQIDCPQNRELLKKLNQQA